VSATLPVGDDMPAPTNDSTSPPRKPHAEAKKSGFSATRRLHERQILTGVSVGLSAILFAIFASGPGKWNALVLALSVGAYFVIAGVRGVREGSALPLLSASLNLVRAGKLVEAEALLASLSSAPRSRSGAAGVWRSWASFAVTPWVSLGVDLQRAQIAMRRGDPTIACDHLDALISRADLRKRAATDGLVAEAHGLRAWALALRGDARVQADIDAVRGAEIPFTTALAHASLAEALLALRSGARSALAAILRRERGILLHGLDVRERALVRAMQRLLATPATGIYRTPASVEKGAKAGDEPPVVEWIRRVAPELLPFAPRPPAVSDPSANALDPEPSPSAAMVARVTARAESATSESTPGVALWVIFSALFLIVYRLGPVPVGPVPLDPWLTLAALLFPGIALGAARLLGAHRRAVYGRLVALSSRIARGDDVDAEVAELAESEQDAGPLAALIELLLAEIADRRALLGKALQHADVARAKLRTVESRTSAASFVSPAVTASRAYSLAALRRADEALAELSQLPADYIRLDSTRFVVRLVSLVALGDIDAAGRLADATPLEISIGPRDELLRDLVRAVTSPGGADVAEMARLREDLRDDDDHRVWIERVAPDLLARFERAAVEKQGQRIHDDSEEAVIAELAAFAEEEAESRPAGRRAMSEK